MSEKYTAFIIQKLSKGWYYWPLKSKDDRPQQGERGLGPFNTEEEADKDARIKLGFEETILTNEYIVPQ